MRAMRNYMAINDIWGKCVLPTKNAIVFDVRSYMHNDAFYNIFGMFSVRLSLF